MTRPLFWLPVAGLHRCLILGVRPSALLGMLRKTGSGVITSRYNAKKFFLDVDNEVHGARFGYNPTVQAFYTMRLYSADGITVLSPFMLFVDVEYLVEAFNKKGPLSYYEGVV